MVEAHARQDGRQPAHTWLLVLTAEDATGATACRSTALARLRLAEAMLPAPPDAYANWGGALMPEIQPQPPLDAVAPANEAAAAAADRARNMRAQIRRRAVGERCSTPRSPAPTLPSRGSARSSNPRRSNPRSWFSSSGSMAPSSALSASSAREISKSDLRARLSTPPQARSARHSAAGSMGRSKRVRDVGLLDAAAVFLPMPISPTPLGTPPGAGARRVSASPTSSIGWHTKSAEASPVGPAIELLPKDYVWVSTPNAFRQRALMKSIPDFNQKFATSAAARAAAPTKQHPSDTRPLRKGDVVNALVGERKGEDGSVQAVWRSNADEVTGEVRTEVVVRYREGGSWFRAQDLERIGTGRVLPPLWAAFEQEDRKFRINVDHSVRRMKATAERTGQVTINDLIEGKMNAEHRAMIEAMQMRERTKRVPFSTEVFESPPQMKKSLAWDPSPLAWEELKMFRAVHEDDVERLQVRLLSKNSLI